MVEDIGSAIEKINEWLSKPVVITCNLVKATPFPQVLECAHGSTVVEYIVFNIGPDEVQPESTPIVCSGYQSYVGNPAVPGVSGTTFLNKIPGIP